eukprot:g11867.t1
MAMMVWEPLTSVDYFLLSFAAFHQAAVLVAVIHLVACREWPPYVVKNIPLVCVTGVAGPIHIFGVVITFGFLDFTSPSLLSNCFFQGVMVWTGAGLYYTSAVVRVYRNYKVLVLHSANMMSPTVQILIAMVPIWAAAFALLWPSVATMDFELNTCRGNARFVLQAVFNYAGLLLIGAVSLLWKMRNARRQMNEYRVMILSLGPLLLSVALVNVGAFEIAHDLTLARRLALVTNVIRGAFLFWPVIYTPLYKFIKRDQDYADSFVLGLEPSITPAMLRASLADQLKIEELWTHFEKIAEEKLHRSVPAFYKAVMDRDKEEGHFERQARTMDIIDTYVHYNALYRMELNLSEPCRQRILASEVTRYNIFNEAAAEVLQVLQEKCEMAFQASPAYEVLLRKAEKEEAEMQALDKAKLVPKQTSARFNFQDRGRGSRSSGSPSSRSERWTNSTVTGSLGNRSDIASQHLGGDMSSPLKWIGEEEDIEKGEGCTCSEERFNTGGLSSFSVDTSHISNSGSGSGRHLFSRGLRRTSTTSPSSEFRDDVDYEDYEEDHEAAATAAAAAAAAARAKPTSTRATSDADSRGLNSPTSSLTPPTRHSVRAKSDPAAWASAARPPQQPRQQSTQPRRPPPTPWAPWRRQPSEPSIAPVTRSPAAQLGDASSASVSMEEGGAAAGAGAGTGRVGERAPYFTSRTVSSATTGSLGSLVMLMPPSTATPPSERTSAGLGAFGSGVSSAASIELGHVHGSVSASSEGGGGGGAPGGRVPGGGQSADTGPSGAASPRKFVPAEPWQRWVNATFILEEEEEDLEEEEEEEREERQRCGSCGRGSGSGSSVCTETCADFTAKSGFVPTSGYQPKTAWLEVAILKETKETEEKGRAEEEARRAATATATATATAAAASTTQATGTATAVLPTTTAAEESEAALQDGGAPWPSSRPAGGSDESMSASLKAADGRGGGRQGEGGDGGSDEKASASRSPLDSLTSSQRDTPPHVRRRPIPIALSPSSSEHSQASFPPASPAAPTTPSRSPMSPLADGAARGLLPPAPLPASPRPSSSPMFLHTASSPSTSSASASPLHGVEVSHLGACSPRMGAEMLHPLAPAPASSAEWGAVVVAEQEQKGKAWPPRPPLERQAHDPHRAAADEEHGKTDTAPSKPGATVADSGDDTGGTAEPDSRRSDHGTGDGQAARQQLTSPPPAQAGTLSTRPEDGPTPPPPPPLAPFPARSPGLAALEAADEDSSAEESEEDPRDLEVGVEVDQTPEPVRSPLTTPPAAERPTRVRKAATVREEVRKVLRRERAPRNRGIAAEAAQAQAALVRQHRAAGVEATVAAAAAVATAAAAATTAGAPSSPAMASTGATTKRPACAQPARAPAWSDLPLPPVGTEAKRSPAEEAPASARAPAPAQQLPRGAGVGFGVAVGVAASAPMPPAAARSWPPSSPPSSPPSMTSNSAAGTRQGSPITAQAPAPAPSTPAAAAAGAGAGALVHPLSSSPPTRTSPITLSLTTVGALPCHYLFTPPSPAGRSNSASPTSSFRSSPPPARPPLLPPAVPLSGGRDRDRDRDRDLAPSEPVFPLVWSLSDSTLSGGSRSTGGRGGGMSSVATSVRSDAASPLVGMRFVAGEGSGCAAGAGAGAPKERSRPNSWSQNGRGVPLMGVRGSMPLALAPPLALGGVGRSMQGEAEAAAAAVVAAAVPICRAPATLPVAGAGPATAVSH